MTETGGEIEQANGHDASSDALEQPRRPGRPKGLGKVPGSGRRKRAAADGGEASGDGQPAITPCTCNGRYASRKLRSDDLYDAMLADEIIDRISNGETLTKICSERPRMPSDGTVRKWVRENIDGFTACYQQARALAYDAMEDHIRDVCNDAKDDYIIDLNGKPVLVHESVHRSKLKADSLKWILSKQRPERYGDRVAVTGHPDAPPIQVEDATPRELARVVLDVLRSARLDQEAGPEELNGHVLGNLTAGIGAPRGLFGAAPGIVEAELVADDPAGEEEAIDIEDFAPGDLASVGRLNIEFDRRDPVSGDSRWHVLDNKGSRIASIWGVEKAKEMSQELAASGKLKR